MKAHENIFCVIREIHINWKHSEILRHTPGIGETL